MLEQRPSGMVDRRRSTLFEFVRRAANDSVPLVSGCCFRSLMHYDGKLLYALWPYTLYRQARREHNEGATFFQMPG